MFQNQHEKMKIKIITREPIHTEQRMENTTKCEASDIEIDDIWHMEFYLHEWRKKGENHIPQFSMIIFYAVCSMFHRWVCGTKEKHIHTTNRVASAAPIISFIDNQLVLRSGQKDVVNLVFIGEEQSVSQLTSVLSSHCMQIGSNVTQFKDTFHKWNLDSIVFSFVFIPLKKKNSNFPFFIQIQLILSAFH